MIDRWFDAHPRLALQITVCLWLTAFALAIAAVILQAMGH